MEVVNKCNGLWRLTVEHGPAQPELAPSAAVTLPTNQDATLRRIGTARGHPEGRSDFPAELQGNLLTPRFPWLVTKEHPVPITSPKR